MFKNILLNNLIVVSRNHLRCCVALLSSAVAVLAMFLVAPQAYAQVLGATASFAPTSVVSGANAVLTITISNLVPSTSFANLSTTAPLPLAGFQVVGPSPISNTCPSAVNLTVATQITLTAQPTPTILPSSTCTISVNVVATGLPGSTGTFTLPINALSAIDTTFGLTVTAPTQTLTVPATIIAAPAITLTTSPVVFGPQTINTTSPAQVVTLTNSGTANLTLNAPTSTGPFAFTTTCPFFTPPVAPGGSCTFTVTFTPTVVGAATGTIDFSSNAPSSPTSISLSGTGSAVAVPGVVITPTPPTPLTFAPRTVGTTSNAQTILLANTGTAALLIGSITITTGATDFAQVPTLSESLPPDCGAILPANQQCSISITFTPQAAGPSTGNVQIVTNATPRFYNVPLAGSGLGTTVGLLAVSDAINFGDQTIGTSSNLQTVFISNVGNGFVFVNSVGVAGPNAADFQSSGICGGLVPGASCAVSVSFNPATIGPKTAQLAIGSDAQNAATVNAIGLSGNGVPLPRALAALSATAVGFGNTIFGGTAAPQTVTLTNNGSLPLLIQSATTSAEYTQANNCPASLNPQASCTISLSFTPFGLGPRSGEFVLNSNTADSPNRVLLGGNGCRWFKPPGSRLLANVCRN
jgi:Abnormal spindle-like microcephaly-assoc'd, ASPM-SPD-2-Hydin/Protein of unknown function (DUF1573)